MKDVLIAGVDIGRFAQDPEYKRETILGLAMYGKSFMSLVFYLEAN